MYINEWNIISSTTNFGISYWKYLQWNNKKERQPFFFGFLSIRHPQCTHNQQRGSGHASELHGSNACLLVATVIWLRRSGRIFYCRGTTMTDHECIMKILSVSVIILNKHTLGQAGLELETVYFFGLPISNRAAESTWGGDSLLRLFTHW